jgi:hypothetical protein
MASPTLGATPGPISGMPAFTGTLSGLELFPLVVPPFGFVGSNKAIAAVALARGIVGNYPAQAANTIFAGPMGGAGTATPTFRLAVLADLPQGAAGFPIVGNGAAAPSYQTLPVTGGGIGTTLLSNNGVAIANGTSAFGVVAATTAGYVLTSQGTASAPAWQAPGSVGLPPTILTSSAAYTVGASDFVILYQRSTSLATTILHLPTGASRVNQTLIVAVLDNNATAFPVDILPNGAETISGQGTAILQTNYGGIRLVGLSSGGWYVAP